jgi:hypothetical protein
MQYIKFNKTMNNVRYVELISKEIHCNISTYMTGLLLIIQTQIPCIGNS